MARPHLRKLLAPAPRAARRLVEHFGVDRISNGPATGMRIGRRNASSPYGAGDVEVPVQRALSDLLHEGAVFYDIGANVGFFSLVASSLVGPSGRVHAFEPRSSILPALRRNIALNRSTSITVWPVAVGAAGGIVDLNCTTHPGGASIVPGEVPDLAYTEPVTVVVVDDLVRDGLIDPPHVVKIDVEGAEVAVLRGMLETLQTHGPCVVIELDDSDPRRLEGKRAEVDELLTSHGYAIEVLEASYESTSWSVFHGIARPTGR